MILCIYTGVVLLASHAQVLTQMPKGHLNVCKPNFNVKSAAGNAPVPVSPVTSAPILHPALQG